MGKRFHIITRHYKNKNIIKNMKQECIKINNLEILLKYV